MPESEADQRRLDERVGSISRLHRRNTGPSFERPNSKYGMAIMMASNQTIDSASIPEYEDLSQQKMLGWGTTDA